MTRKTLWRDWPAKTEEAAGQRNLKEWYDITRKLAGTRRKDEQHVIDKTGQVLTNQAVKLNRWKEYFEELLNRPSSDDPPDIPQLKHHFASTPTNGQNRKLGKQSGS